MAANNWHVPKHSPTTLGNGDSTPSASTPLDDDESNNSPVNLEETAYDQISRLILAQFEGHGLADLVGTILEAQNHKIM